MEGILSNTKLGTKLAKRAKKNSSKVWEAATMKIQTASWSENQSDNTRCLHHWWDSSFMISLSLVRSVYHWWDQSIIGEISVSLVRSVVLGESIIGEIRHLDDLVLTTVDAWFAWNQCTLQMPCSVEECGEKDQLTDPEKVDLWHSWGWNQCGRSGSLSKRSRAITVYRLLKLACAVYGNCSTNCCIPGVFVRLW